MGRVTSSSGIWQRFTRSSHRKWDRSLGITIVTGIVLLLILGLIFAVAYGSRRITTSAGSLHDADEALRSATVVRAQLALASHMVAVDQLVTDAAQVTITIITNQAPTATADVVTLESYQQIRLDVLANDTDPEGDALTISSITTASFEGTVRLNEDSTITYTPHNGQQGRDTFTYLAVDADADAATGRVIINIPPAVIETANRITQQLGTNNLPFQSPTEPAIATVGLEIGHVTLLAEAVYQSLGALTLPLTFLFISILAVILLGSLAEIPLLFAGRRRHWSVVLMSREATLPVHQQPDHDSEIIYRYAATATGIASTDEPHDSFVAVDSPRGPGYIDTAYLTPTVDLDHFIADPRPAQMVRRLRDALEAGEDIRRFISPRGLVIALTNEPILISPNRLIGNIRTTTPGRDTATVALQIDVFETLRQALLDLADINPNMAHSRNALIPTQLWNFPYLAIQAPNHQPWLIHFEYHNNRPLITGISLDQ